MTLISNIKATWASIATTFTAIKMDVTDTNSASDSKLLDLQVGGVSKFSVGKDGKINNQSGNARDFDTVALLQSDTALTTSNTTAGDIIYAQGFRDEVVASGGDITTAGGVQLDVMASDDGFKNALAYGALGDGVTDDTTAIQTAIDAAGALIIPAGHTFITSGNTVPSNTTIRVDGTLKLKAASPIGSSLLKNSDQVGGNTNIKIYGDGKIDGNKAGQTGVTEAVWHTLVDIDSCDYFEFAVKEVTGNYFPTAISSSFTTAAVYVRNSNYVKVHDCLATDYGREAFWCHLCNYSEIYNLRAIGGVDSWSGVQFSGDYNKADQLYSQDAGASGISFDCRYSTLSNAVVKDNAFSHGINFGHSGIPASFSTASNLISENSADVGINVASTTLNLVVCGFAVRNPAGIGVNSSDGSNHITVADGNVDGAGTHGVKFFATGTVTGNRFKISDVKVDGCTNYGLVIDACLASISNCELDGNTSGAINRVNAAIPHITNTRLHATDVFFASQSIVALGIGGTVTVTNGNVTAFSLIALQPSNANGYAAQAFIQTVNDGSFVIETSVSGASGANVRYWIG